MGLFDRLIDDATMATSAAADAADAALTEHRRLRGGPLGALIGSFVCPDQRLAELGRAAGDDQIEVTVVNTGGAGGLVALGRRDLPGVRIVAVQSALRDLDDLAGNAARVVAASGELGDEVTVFVEIPYAPGWLRAVEEVEAAGLLAALRIAGGGDGDAPSAGRLAEQLSGLVEADLPFTLTGGPDRALPSASETGLVPLMMAVEALIDGAEPREAADLLTLGDPDRVAAAVASWDEAVGTRIRRRLCSVGSRLPAAALADLVGLGLVTPAG